MGLGMGVFALINRWCTPKSNQVQNVNQAQIQQRARVPYADVFVSSTKTPTLLPTTGVSAVDGGNGASGITATVGNEYGFQGISGNVISQVAGNDSTGGWPTEFTIADKTNNHIEGNEYTFKLVNADELKEASGKEIKPNYKCVHIKARVKSGSTLNPNDVTYKMGDNVQVKDGKIITDGFKMHIDTSKGPKSPLLSLPPLQNVTDANSTVQEWSDSSS